MRPDRSAAASLGVALTLACAVGAPPAAAGTAAIVMRDACAGDLACSKFNAGWTVPVATFSDPVAEPNRVTVSRTASALVIADSGAPLTVGTGCTALDEHTAQCPVPAETPSLRVIELDLGGGDDQLLVDGNLGTTAMLIGGEGDDDIRGGAERDTINAGRGSDRIDGGQGMDAVSYATRTASVVVDLRAGRGGEPGEKDALAGVESVTGGSGDDHLAGGEGDDELDGGSGDDSLDGHAGDDNLSGGEGSDVIDAGDGNDSVESDPEQGDDYYTAVFRPGDDVVSGGGGHDQLTDSAGGRNLLQGGSGNDVIEAGRGRDRLIGGAGDDDLLDEAGGNDVLDGGAGNDRLRGGPGADRLAGGRGTDLLYGGPGVDRLAGGAGRDRLFSRDRRAERLDCGRGRDVASADRVDRKVRCERVAKQTG